MSAECGRERGKLESCLYSSLSCPVFSVIFTCTFMLFSSFPSRPLLCGIPPRLFFIPFLLVPLPSP